MEEKALSSQPKRKTVNSKLINWHRWKGIGRRKEWCSDPVLCIKSDSDEPMGYPLCSVSFFERLFESWWWQIENVFLSLSCVESIEKFALQEHISAFLPSPVPFLSPSSIFVHSSWAASGFIYCKSLSLSVLLLFYLSKFCLFIQGHYTFWILHYPAMSSILPISSLFSLTNYCFFCLLGNWYEFLPGAVDYQRSFFETDSSTHKL